MKTYKAEESYQESRFNWLLFLLALFINIAILLLLFFITTEHNFWEFKKDEFNQPEAPVSFHEIDSPPEPPPAPSVDEIAALKPGASHFGMPDEFNEDEFTAAFPGEQSNEKSLQKPKLPPPLEKQQAAQPLEQPQAPAQPIPEQHEKTIQQIPASLTLDKQTEKPETKMMSVPELPQQETIMTKLEQPLSQKIAAPIKKELTFNDIARGFLSSLDEGGNDLMKRKGNENIRPDFEEMRSLSYMHKIIWHMQNEWHRDTSLMNYPIPYMVVTGVSITIDKQGVLKDAHVVQSSGCSPLDDAIIRGIYAASPYPPLPTHLKKDFFTVQFGVKHVSNGNNMRSNFHFR